MLTREFYGATELKNKDTFTLQNRLYLQQDFHQRLKLPGGERYLTFIQFDSQPQKQKQLAILLPPPPPHHFMKIIAALTGWLNR